MTFASMGVFVVAIGTFVGLSATRGQDWQIAARGFAVTSAILWLLVVAHALSWIK